MLKRGQIKINTKLILVQDCFSLDFYRYQYNQYNKHSSYCFQLKSFNYVFNGFRIFFIVQHLIRVRSTYIVMIFPQYPTQVGLRNLLFQFLIQIYQQYQFINNKMNHTQLETLIRVNEQLGDQIFDLKIPRTYSELTGNCLIQDFHHLVRYKFNQNKKVQINQMVKILAEMTPFCQEQIIEILNSNKNTDITKFLTSILITDMIKRESFEKIRKELVINIRKNLTLKNDQITAFYLIYNQIYAISQVQREIAMHDIYADLNSLKKMLMSLKKMMGETKHETNTHKSKKDHYSINLDIKKLLSDIAEKLEGTKEGQMIQDLVEQSQSKKWLGPRLYKMLQQKNWGFDQTVTLINSLRSMKLKGKDLRSPPETLKVVVKSILINLRKYRKSCKKTKIVQNQSKVKIQENKISDHQQAIEEQQQGKLFLITKNQSVEKDSNLQFFQQFRWEVDSFLKFDQVCSESIFPIQEEDIKEFSQGQ